LEARGGDVDEFVEMADAAAAVEVVAAKEESAE
jgi:hypothetical protein